MIQKADNSLILLKQESSVRGTVFVLSLSTLITSLALSSINIILPELVSSLDTSFHHVQWVIIAYMLFLTSTLVIAGRFSDILGRKKLFFIGLIIFTISAGICGFTQNLWLLIGLRAIQGIGGAILIAVTMAFVGDVFPKSKVTLAMGILGSMSAIGTGLGPVFGGLIVDNFNWHIIFLINIPLGLFIYLLARKYLPADIQTTIKPPLFVDCLSIVLLFSTILVYTLSIRLIEDYFDITSLVFILLSLFLLLVFIFVQRNSNPPLIKLSILKENELITSLISNFIVSTVVMSSLVIGPFYLIVALGLSTTQAGFAMAVSPLTVATTSYLVGRIANEYNLKKMILIGLFIITLAAIGMTLLRITHGLVGYLFCLITMAIGYATFLLANNTLTMTKTSSQTRGSISGILNLSRNLGLLTGASLMSSIFASVSSITAITTANSHMVEGGLHAVYQFAIALLTIAITVQIIAIHKKSKTVKQCNLT